MFPVVSREHHVTIFPKPTKRTSTASTKTTTVANHSFIKLGKSLKNCGNTVETSKGARVIKPAEIDDSHAWQPVITACIHQRGVSLVADEQPWVWRCRHSQTDNNRLHCSWASAAMAAFIPRSKSWISSGRDKTFKDLKLQEVCRKWKLSD